MGEIKLLHIIIALGFILSCSTFGCKEDIDHDLEVFIPSFEVSPADLLKDKFKRVPDVDIPTYYKVNEDTTVIYTFNFEGQELFTKSWRIKVEDSDSVALSKFFRKYQLPAIYQEQFFNNSGEKRRKNLVYNYLYNQVYEFDFDSINREIIVHYFYYYPAE